MKDLRHPLKKLFRTHWVALTAIGALACWKAPAQARDAGAFGGNGGSNFRQTCRSGDVLIGINARVGKALDQVNGVCAKIGRDGRRTSVYLLGSAGGGGGNARNLRCAEHNAVRQIRVFLDRGGQVVQSVHLTCEHFETKATSVRRPGDFGGSTVGSIPLICNSSEYANGLYGRSGALVDRLGLQCANFRPPVAAPPRPPAQDPAPTTQAPTRPTGLGYMPATIVSDVQVFRQIHGQGGLLGTLRRGDRVQARCNAGTNWCAVRGEAVERATGQPVGQVFIDFVRQ